jgi:hypothetical protein
VAGIEETMTRLSNSRADPIRRNFDGQLLKRGEVIE